MKKLGVFSVPSTPEPGILVLCPWQEGNISPNGDKTHRPGDGFNIEGEGERGRGDSKVGKQDGGNKKEFYKGRP